ncbi:Uncharacterized RING finger protein [Morus notabilis]|uniref:Uncharacterized RING finger protein n=1 Tax=Morus notabilis TaxID=981085 RepID=W9RY04_9ROSA|nr:probable E3 ubiquitin-protein ligase RHA1A [Morus notabilis]EXC02144.1 Uncharacterized RING finger protein [Morus notabilis]
MHDSIEEGEEEAHDQRLNYLLVLDDESPFVVPVPMHVITSHIKKKLPILEFGQLDHQQEVMEDKLVVKYCTICLECLERRDEVRKLFNCDHVFHKECLDCWVDEGQVTCPLCRSMLFPAEEGREILKEIHAQSKSS